MSSIVLLSSSPPPIFARSPTVHDTSPSLPSPSALLKSEREEGCKQFKSRGEVRDGFSNDFSIARSLLSAKVGAENIPPKSTRRNNFDDIGKRNESKTQRVPPGRREPAPIQAPARGSPCAALQEQAGTSRRGARQQSGVPDPEENSRHVIDRPTENLSSDDSPLLLDKAIPRRLDWTPVKESSIKPESDVELRDASQSFSKELWESFGFSNARLFQVSTKPAANGEATKRRRLDVLDDACQASTAKAAAKANVKVKGSGHGPGQKRSKSPPKRNVTITGLATSHYGGDYEKDDIVAVPMLRYLTATQASVDGYGGDEMSNSQATKHVKKNTPLEKAGSAKRSKSGPRQGGRSKSRLLSPQSALKALDGQEMLFGSASQLARDDSPTFLRDTLEALKKSESTVLSDPISPQPTQPVSIDCTTPRADRGTLRFRKTRNLWAAAGRDEENALLHIDTVDMFDTPAVRLALAGKDVLLEPSRPSTHVSKGLPPHRHSSSHPDGRSSLITCFDESLYDIDDITTPAKANMTNSTVPMQRRTYHTSGARNAKTSNASTNLTSSEQAEVRRSTDMSAAPPQDKPLPAKPSFVGLPTHELQKQISAYGFKPVKKRDKMIELLERCWEDKYGPSNSSQPEGAVMMTHGDFLTKVHDLSSRPAPKVKRSRAKARGGETDGRNSKEPKSRKKSEPRREVTTAAKDQVPRKRKTKNSEDLVVDIEDLDVVETEDKAHPKAVTRPSSSAHEILPPTLSASTNGLGQSSPALTGGSPGPDMNEQIKKAVLASSSSDTQPRDHAKDPTWHEKILMYDPIVLEDLTTWLNTEGLGKIGEDREVSSLDVRDWCESNGICCLWRGGWRGRKLKEQNGD